MQHKPPTRPAGQNIQSGCFSSAKAAGPCDGAIGMSPKCERCDDSYWVCEAHSHLPSDLATSPRACQCGALAMPCPDCNPFGGPDERPKLPPGFMLTLDDKGPRN